MTTLPRSRPRRLLRVAGLLTVLAALGAAVWSEAGHADDTAAPSTTASPLGPVEVTSGDLTADQRVDGTVQELGGRTVVHRIEGETSSGATSGNASSSSGSASGGASASAVAPSGTGSVGTDEATVGQTESLVALAVAVTPDTTSPAAPPDTTVATAPADTIAPADTTAPTDTTMPADEGAGGAGGTGSTGSTGGAAPVGGGAPSGGGSPSTGTAGDSASGSSGSAASTTSTTRATELVTWVAPVGTSIGSGDPIYTVEGTPVVAMYGSICPPGGRSPLGRRRRRRRPPARAEPRRPRRRPRSRCHRSTRNSTPTPRLRSSAGRRCSASR
jgi:hypothetical protein